MRGFEAFFSSPLFGIVLCIFAYSLGHYISGKFKVSWINPMLLALIFCILFMVAFNIPLEYFDKGGDILQSFLGPVTAILAVPIYHKRDLLKRNFLPIVIGAVVGSATALASVYAMCKLYGLDDKLTATMLPKSVTAPIALKISSELGGMPSVTIAAVMVTGITGGIFAPLLLKLIRAKNPVASGIAIGTSSHAFGTSRAIEIGETQGAMSGLALSIAGIATVFLSLLFR
jgi:predicted murein hydrolase (TIGR00659 family)